MKRALQIFATSKTAAVLIFLLAASLAFRPISFFKVFSVVLLFLLIVSIVAVIFQKFPYKFSSFPFILSHAGVLIVILGAVMSFFFSSEFEVEMFEQEKIFRDSIKNDQGKTLPFSIKLSDVRRIYDTSNNMATGFESDIEVEDAARGIIKKSTVKLNNPIRYRGYSIIQNGYIESVPEGMIFLIRHDPGRVFFYFGFASLFFGMFYSFFKKRLADNPN
jgi:cytochrome c biogenesis protein ResB